MKLFPLNECSALWITESKFCELSSSPENADFIIFESEGDPFTEIKIVQKKFHADKLVFILSGDIDYSDAQSIWFASTIKPNNINKFQIYLTNPRMSMSSPEFGEKDIFAYFGGTIWNSEERLFLKELPNNFLIEEIKGYWNLNPEDKIEVTKKSYLKMRRSVYTLCPKGKGSSSMRILEAMANGSIPVLINDSSNPFYENYGNLVLRVANDHLLDMVNIVNNNKFETLDFLKCYEFYKKNVHNPFTSWSVCLGFHDKIVSRLQTIFNRSF